ncbi:MAG: TolC family protein, partial [Bacteroidetes bacterium]|nr:TolC family protein [Bacteroidota bacterium]
MVTISMMTTTTANAQQPIELKAAIDSAYSTNLTLRSEKLNVEAYSNLKHAGWDLPQTSLTGEYGQFNSAFKDTKFGISQGFKFPTVYLKQKSVYTNEWQNAELTLEARKAELKKEVSSSYYNLVYTLQLKTILLEMDSIYSVFLKNAELKFDKGESNILEKNTAISQRGQIQLQLQEVEKEYANLVLEFNLLLNTKAIYIPINALLKLDAPAVGDAGIIKQHPFLQQLEQQQQISESKLKLERSMLLPDLFAGYNNTSITGMGPDNIYYNSSSRFQSIHAGIGIPLFFGSQKAKISTLKINQQIANNNVNAGTAMLELNYKKAVQEFATNSKM